MKFTHKINSAFCLLAMLTFANGQPASAADTALLDSSTNRTLVPIRFVSESLGANVDWNASNSTVDIENGKQSIQLKIGDKSVIVNKEVQKIDAPPFIKESTTYVPLRFVSTSLGADVEWESATAMVVIEMNEKTIKLATKPYVTSQQVTTAAKKADVKAITNTTKSFTVNGKNISSDLITVDLDNPSIDLEVALAEGKVGAVDSLENIAKKNNAEIAINGTFFDAYTEVTEPYGVIIVDGESVHIGKQRTVFSFDDNNNVQFNIANPEVVGSTNGSNQWPHNWYSYWLNRTPQYNSSSSAIIFTPARGEKVGFDYGTNVIVENGKVTDITTGNVGIPKNGFVINLLGTEVHNLLDRFKKGTTVSYVIEDENLNFDKTDGAIGAGPRLVTNGKITVDFEKEGFKDDKVTKARAARSAIGVTKENQLLLLTTRGATIHELAEMMQQAGAYQAMNLDGGASSGLYYNGGYITKPGREISNAILIKLKK